MGNKFLTLLKLKYLFFNLPWIKKNSYNAWIYSAMNIFIIADFLLCQCCYQLQYSQCHWTQLTILWQLLEAKMTRHMFGEYKMERRIWNVLVGFDKVEDIMGQIFKTKSNLSRSLTNLWTSRSQSLVSCFKKINVFLVFSICFHKTVDKKWCLGKIVEQIENDLEHRFVKHWLNCV